MKRIPLLIALLLMATLPMWVGNSYYVNIATQMLIYAILALDAECAAVGYAGLVTLGHAGLFGIAAYAGAVLINDGYDHMVVTFGALLVTVAATAIFAVLALRGTGLGFVMITVALGQIVWGIAYRWISLTNGDNGISITVRPAPFGLSLTEQRPSTGRALSYSCSPSPQWQFSSPRRSARPCAVRATSRGA